MTMPIFPPFAASAVPAIKISLAAILSLACFGWAIWLKIKPDPYENCVLKPRDWHRRRSNRRSTKKKGPHAH